MADKHYPIDREIEVTIKIKVKNIKIHNYQSLNEIQIHEHVQGFENEISQHIKEELSHHYQRQDVTFGIDGWDYQLE